MAALIQVEQGGGALFSIWPVGLWVGEWGVPDGGKVDSSKGQFARTFYCCSVQCVVVMPLLITFSTIAPPTLTNSPKPPPSRVLPVRHCLQPLVVLGVPKC